MPSGGVMQLVSYGSENLYLTGNPQITFFKTAYQRHTNFAYEWIPQHFEPTLSFDTTSRTNMTVPIKRNGDLVRDITLVLDLPNIYSTASENFKWIKNIGHIIIHDAELLIGAQSISKLYGQWMNIWYELTTPISRKEGFNELIGNVKEMYNPICYYGEISDNDMPTIQKRRLRIPIPFWFTKHPGLAIPLISIQYTEITINFEFRALNDLFTIGIPAVSPLQLFENPISENHRNLKKELSDQGYGPNNIFWKFVSGLLTPGLWNQNVYLDIKYVYLDNTERRVFASAVSEYLITQVERLEFRGLHGSEQEDIEFFHPVKEMIWIFQRDDVSVRNQWTNYTTLLHDEDYPTFLEKYTFHKNLEDFNVTTPNNLIDIYLPSGLTIKQFIKRLHCTDTEKLSLTDIDAFDKYVNIMYFGEFLFNSHLRQNRKSTIYYTTEEPYDTHTTTPSCDKQIYMMSFSEKPEMIQPSGTANFSMFKKAQFNFTLKERIAKNDNTDSLDNSDIELFNMFFYVRSINVLRIMNGIGGLVFAN